MRIEFVQRVTDVLTKDSSSVFLTGDLGYNAFENIALTLGHRFLNVGVAEQNMVGLAAGMALSGMLPWIYSIAPFAVYRCFEQIRNDVCFHNLDVRIVGNGGGYTYGIMGSTHHALEDLGVLKTLPNMALVFPSTKDQVFAAVDCIHALRGPSYLRLAISGLNTEWPVLWDNPQTLTRQYSSGDGVTIIGVGHAVHIALSALKKGGLNSLGAEVFSISRFPFDLDSDKRLVDSVLRTGRLVFIDEHYGFGSISESLLRLLPKVDNPQVLCAQYFRHQRYGGVNFHLSQSQMTDNDLVRLVRSLTINESPRSLCLKRGIL